jgi:hypothetical protein
MAYQKLQPGRAANVTPNDDVNIINPADGLPTKEGCVLYIGSAEQGGNKLRVLTVGGDDVTFYNVIQGTFLPIQVLRVFESDTTDVDKILALW